MSTGPSRKELRRQAALQEKERRSRAEERLNLERVTSVEWGTASLFPEQTRVDIIRLGGVPISPRSRDPIQILAGEIKWPLTQFRSSTSLFHQRECDSSLDTLDETTLQDAMPVRCFGFQFVAGDQADELQDVMQLDVECFRAIGRDDHHYFLVGRNPRQANDPLLYVVSQQASDESPYHPEPVTIGWLLAVLATA